MQKRRVKKPEVTGTLFDDAAKLMIFSETVAFWLKTYRWVHHTVEYGVGGSCVCLKTVVPVGDWDLRCEDSRLTAMTVFDYLHQVRYLIIVEVVDSEVIDDDGV